MMADDLRGDGAAEGEAVEDRGNALRADLLVEARRGDAVVDDAVQRGDAAAAAEAAIVEKENVDAGSHEVRHDLGEMRDVAGVAVAVERRGDRLVGVAV